MRTRKKAALATLAFFLITAGGCGGKTTGAADKANSHSRFLIKPGVGVGEVKLGMMRAEVVSRFGNPDHQTGTIAYYLDFGMIVNYDAQEMVSKVVCGTPIRMEFMKLAPFKRSTEEGIRIGSSRKDVVDAFGNPPKSFIPPGDATAETLSYESLGLILLLDDGKVRLFRVVPPIRG